MPYELKNRTDKELINVENYPIYRHQIREGETVRLICEVIKSNPPLNRHIRWFINDYEIDEFNKIYSNGKSNFKSNPL